MVFLKSMKESKTTSKHTLPVPSLNDLKEAEPYFKSPHIPPVKSYNEDILGIISLVCIFWFPPMGVVLGLVGAHVAKAEGRDPLLSRIGWIINSVITVVFLFLIIAAICLIAFSKHNS